MPAIINFLLPEYNGGHNRFVFLDVARAAVIIYIVLIIHGLYYTEIWSGAIKSIFLFEMPLIFLVSGYSYFLFEKKHYNGLFQAKHFTGLLFNKIARIFLPYWVYAIACIAIIIAYYEHAGKTYSAANVIFKWLNPFAISLDCTVGSLYYHLWFVPVFFFISLLLPFVAKIRLPRKMPIRYIWLISLIIAYLNSILDSQVPILHYIIFYFLWAYLGYRVAMGISAGLVDFIFVFIISLAGLTFMYLQGTHTLNMQINKFPPNFIFFLFNSMWISLILLAVGRFNLNKRDYTNTANYLKPVILRGYSIYLWQGLSYTITGHFLGGSTIENLLAIIVSFCATICLGVIFGPFEQIKYTSIQSSIRNIFAR